MATMPNYIWHCMASKTILPKIFGIGGINDANLALSADLCVADQMRRQHSKIERS